MRSAAPNHDAVTRIATLAAIAGLAAFLGACSPAHRAAPAAAAIAEGPAAAEPDRTAAPAERTESPVAAEAPAEPEPVGAPPPAPALAPAHVAAVDFHTEILPILEARCQPCHFPGGKMYDRLPFDRPETLYLLGTKLFTRIRDADEQALLRGFLEQGADG